MGRPASPCWLTSTKASGSTFNDIVCQRDGTIWFTDPAFGISGWFGGPPCPSFPESFYRLSADGELRCMDDNPGPPNGLAFSPDGSCSM